MKRWQFWLGVAVSVVFLWLALRGLDLALFWDALKHADYVWLIPGVLVYFGAVWARSWRWHYLLRNIKVVPVRELFPAVTIGYMGNNIYPARAGELLRAYVLKKDEGVSMSASVATIVVERIFDMGQYLYDAIEKDQQTNPCHESAFDILQHSLGKGHDLFNNRLLAFKFLKEKCLYGPLKSKTLRNAEHHCENGNNGKKGVKCKGGGTQLASVFVDSTNSQQDDAQESNEEPFALGKIFGPDSPDIPLNELVCFRDVTLPHKALPDEEVLEKCGLTVMLTVRAAFSWKKA